MTELKWIGPVIMSGDSPEIISSPEMHSLPLERAKLVMFLCMALWPWVWLWTYGDLIQNKRQNPQSKLFACVWLCNWNCIYWEEACDLFLSFRSFMYNQWRKMFLCSGDFDTSLKRPTITSSELILTVAVSWQPITDVLHVESNQKIVCEFAFAWSKRRFMSTVS